jgi:hypothetical protein
MVRPPPRCPAGHQLGPDDGRLDRLLMRAGTRNESVVKFGESHLNQTPVDIVHTAGCALVRARKRRVNMMHKLFCASCMVAVAVIGPAPAYANPAGHGNTCGSSGQTSTPGNAATSPGSPFNEPGTNSPSGGKGGQAYNNAQANNKVGATAQYDTACKNVTANGTGTPPPTTTPTADITNNSQATRAANGVISHTGKGATK